MSVQVSSEEAAEAPPLEPLDEYVMVEKDDVMEAISAFVAAYLVQLPEAQHLKPDELQRALGGAIAVCFCAHLQMLRGQHPAALIQMGIAAHARVQPSCLHQAHCRLVMKSVQLHAERHLRTMPGQSLLCHNLCTLHWAASPKQEMCTAFRHQSLPCDLAR